MAYDNWDFAARVDRAFRQRIYLVETTPFGDDGAEFAILGTTRNIYTVSIHRKVTCTCPDYKRRDNLCKHCLFVVMRVLGVDPNDAATLANDASRKTTPTIKTALCRLLAGTQASHAPQTTERVRRAYHLQNDNNDNDNNVRTLRPSVDQKPLDDDDACPVCFETLLDSAEDMIFCRWSCGKSVHAECFDKWAARRPVPTCVYCRAEWNQSKYLEPPPPRKTYAHDYVHIPEQVGL